MSTPFYVFKTAKANTAPILETRIEEQTQILEEDNCELCGGLGQYPFFTDTGKFEGYIPCDLCRKLEGEEVKDEEAWRHNFDRVLAVCEMGATSFFMWKFFYLDLEFMYFLAAEIAFAYMTIKCLQIALTRR